MLVLLKALYIKYLEKVQKAANSFALTRFCFKISTKMLFGYYHFCF